MRICYNYSVKINFMKGANYVLVNILGGGFAVFDFN